MIKGGDTPNFSQKHLCSCCTYGTVVKGETFANQITLCSRADHPITFKVIECNSFLDRSQPSLFQMQQVAWKIASDRKTKKIGFYAPQRYYKLLQEDAIETQGADFEN